MSLIDQYLTLEQEIKERALYVNNLVANYISDNDIDDDSYRFNWCGVVEISYLGFTLCGRHFILEFDDGDSYPITWNIPTDWIDMSDEEIIQDYLSELARRREIDKLTSIQKLERQANELGFILTKQ